MARAWFFYTKTNPNDACVASNYSTSGDLQNCSPINAINICAVFATVSGTQPVITTNLCSYLNAACAWTPCSDQPAGLAVKKYVLVRPQ